MNNDYSGIYSSGSPRKPFKVVMGVAGFQHYLKTYGDIEQALEAWNNAAFWLGHCGRGLRIPLQGSQELKDRYNLKFFNGLNDAPQATEETKELLKWAEKTLPEVEEPRVSSATVPGALVQCIRVLSEQVQIIEKQVAQAIENIRQQLYALQGTTDPRVLEACSKRDLILQRYDAASGNYKAMFDKMLEEIYTEFPAARPS